MLTLEDEEEVGHSQDYMVKKGVHMYHPSVISCPLPFGEVHNSLRVTHIFGDMSRVLLQGHELLRLGARYRLGAPNSWDTTSRPQVLGRNVGETVHLISIRSTRRSCLHPQIWIEIWVGRKIIPVSLPQPAIKCLLKIKKLIIKFNSRK